MASQSLKSRGPNLIVGLVVAGTFGLLYVSYDPIPAGAAPTSEADRVAEAVAEFIVPLPPEVPELVASADDSSEPDETDAKSSTIETDQPVASLSGQLTNDELIEYFMLLLRDGGNYLKSFDTYTATFHKQERLGGDLSEVQMIDIKIRQHDQFAVYMKWRNGDRGRQLLYSTEYEDGDMVVKLGGFKGRLLPGIKVSPHGSMARDEARHPVTQAGICGMLDQMIEYREQELKRGHGIDCQRLPNQTFDDRECLCFLYQYEQPGISGGYRKSLILIDGDRHIPVMARNYTWATEADDLSPAGLDELTLVENYSFTNIDFSRKLTASDFSRDNPRYRM